MMISVSLNSFTFTGLSFVITVKGVWQYWFGGVFSERY